MARKDGQTLPQITIGNSETTLIHLAEDMPDGLPWWVEQYFRFEVTTSPASQKCSAAIWRCSCTTWRLKNGQTNGWHGRHGSPEIFSATCSRRSMTRGQSLE